MKFNYNDRVAELMDLFLKYMIDNGRQGKLYFLDPVDSPEGRTALALLETEQLIRILSGKQPTDIVHITPKGEDVYLNGGYKAFVIARAEAAKIKDDLELRKLKSETINAERLKKYFWWSVVAAAISLIVSIVSLVISLVN